MLDRRTARRLKFARINLKHAAGGIMGIAMRESSRRAHLPEMRGGSTVPAHAFDHDKGG